MSSATENYIDACHKIELIKKSRRIFIRITLTFQNSNFTINATVLRIIKR